MKIYLLLVYQSLVLLKLLDLVQGQQTPTITNISPEQIGDIGGTVDLNCYVQFLQDYPLIWRKVKHGRPAVLLSAGSSKIVTDKRMAISHNTSAYTLQIRDLMENDAGVYQCQLVLAVNNTVTNEVTLHIRTPPIWTDNSTRQITALEKERVLLECYAAGSPTPRISWRREHNASFPSEVYQHSQNVLEISSIRKEDAGIYYCIADNGVQRAIRNITVHVEFAPVITTLYPRVGQALGQDVYLTCNIAAYPPPNAIIWLKNGEYLSQNWNHNFTISHFVVADDFITSKIIMRSIEKARYGKYTCEADNRLGRTSADVVLYETDTPQSYPL